MIPGVLQVDLEALALMQLKASVILFSKIILGRYFLVCKVDGSSLSLLSSESLPAITLSFCFSFS